MHPALAFKKVVSFMRAQEVCKGKVHEKEQNKLRGERKERKRLPLIAYIPLFFALFRTPCLYTPLVLTEKQQMLSRLVQPPARAIRYKRSN